MSENPPASYFAAGDGIAQRSPPPTSSPSPANRTTLYHDTQGLSAPADLGSLRGKQPLSPASLMTPSNHL